MKRFALLTLLLALSGCSAIVEGALVDLPPDCAGVENGGACPGLEDAGEMICLSGTCVESVCGDGFTDPRFEDCDDDSLGCHECRFRCVTDADCDDGNACNGEESCVESEHRCVLGGLPLEGSACVDPEGEPGVCASQACVVSP